jgi:hypothetical protein
MKRIVNLTSVIVFAVALSLLVYLLAWPSGASAFFAEFPAGKPRVVTFDARKGALEGMTRRERVDQLRDWLLFTTVSASGLSAGEINQVMFDVPAIRQGYMQPVANFEYGDTRSCVLGKGEVVALVPAGGSDEERSARLAHIADQQRKNLGQMPETVTVFEYTLGLEAGVEAAAATLTRRETLSASELFTEKYGYYESGISNAHDLEEFMRRADEVTYARMDGGRLTLGGRKLRGRPYRGIRVEDVAAIWQSEAKIQTALEGRKKKIDDFNSRWAHRTYRTPSEGARLQQQHDMEERSLQAELEADAKRDKTVGGSGFSLDPTYDFDALKKEFDGQIAPLLRLLLNEGPTSAGNRYPTYGSLLGGGSSGGKVDEARRGLEKHDIEPLLKTLDELSTSNNPFVKTFEKYMSAKYGLKDANLASTLNSYMTQKFGFQAARYDGYLQKTEVGMVLFYTDLLAKLWALDYANSAPQGKVNGFKAMTSTPVSTAYKKEMSELSNTRLWFGPQAKGFQVADGGQTMLFAQTATRVYAASSNPLKPGAESQANAQSSAFLGWWDNHYEEIARFEPEYERLNEIMKWSLLIGWLNKSESGKSLDFLKSVNVDRSNWFPEWARKRNDLKFTDWDKIGFYEAGHKGSDTEALPLLTSDGYKQFGVEMVLTGGVSLADTAMFESRVALSEETAVTQLLRRSNLDYGASKTAGEAVSFEGIAYKFETLAPERAATTAAIKDGVKLRGAYGEVANLKFQRVVAQEAGGLHVNTRIGEVDLGSLEIGRVGNGFKVGWESLDMDLGQALARRVSEAPEPGRVLASDGSVESFISLGEKQGYVVKLRDSERWLQLTPEGQTVSEVARWESRVGSFSDAAQNYSMTWLKPEDVQYAFASEKVVSVAPAPEAAGRYILKAEATIPRAATQEIELQSGSAVLKGRFNPATGETHFNYRELPEAVRRNPLKLQRLVEEAHITPERARYVVSDLADDTSILNRFRSGDVHHLLDEAASSPAEFQIQLAREFARNVEQSDRLIAAGLYDDAVHRLDDLIDMYGPRAELLIRRGAAKLSSELPEASAPLRKALSEGGAGDPARFFSEINERLRSGGALPENASLVNEGGDMAIHYRLNSPPGGESVPPIDIEGGRALIYVQDSPGLNNLNWHVSVHNSLDQAVSGNFGRVIKLPRADIAKLKPTLIYSPESATSFRAVSETGANVGYRFPTYYYGPNFDDDDDDDKKKKDGAREEYVYLVLANGR